MLPKLLLFHLSLGHESYVPLKGILTSLPCLLFLSCQW